MFRSKNKQRHHDEDIPVIKIPDNFGEETSLGIKPLSVYHGYRKQCCNHCDVMTGDYVTEHAGAPVSGLPKKKKTKRARRKETVAEPHKVDQQPYMQNPYEIISEIQAIPERQEPLPSPPRKIPEVKPSNHVDTKAEKTEKPTEKRHKERVCVSMTFLKIGEFRALEQTFYADVFIKANWREPKLDSSSASINHPEIAAKFKNSRDYWNPELIVDNYAVKIYENVSYDVTHHSDGKCFITERRRVKGLFSTPVALRHYPFDTQHLSIVLKSELQSSELELTYDQDDQHHNYVIRSYKDEQEWTLLDRMHFQRSYILSGNENLKRPLLTVSAILNRNWLYYLFNVLLYTTFTFGLLFGTFAVPPNLIQFRLQLCFIAFLTLVVLKKLSFNDVPKVSYMTLLDCYFLTQISMAFIVALWHMIVYQIQGDASGTNPDHVAVCVIVGVYVLLHLAFVLEIIHIRRTPAKRLPYYY